MNVGQFPAGWYRDPSARHEQRYWDGIRWGRQVLDHGVTTDDPSGAGSDASSTAWAGRLSGAGYRAVRGNAWRLAFLSVGATLVMIAFMFEIWASVMAFNATGTADRSSLFMWTWLYQERTSFSGLTYIGYPPIAIFVVLLLALAFQTGVTIRPDSALRKAGAQGVGLRSPKPEREAWSGAVARLRAQGGGRFSTTLMRPHHRVFLALEILAGLAIMGVSVLAIQGRAALDITGQTLSTVSLSVGLGPWICLIAGAACLLGSIIAWPWRRHDILILPDGTVEALT